MQLGSSGTAQNTCRLLSLVQFTDNIDEYITPGIALSALYRVVSWEISGHKFCGMIKRNVLKLEQISGKR